MKGFVSQWIWLLAGIIVASFIILIFLNLYSNFTTLYLDDAASRVAGKVASYIGDACHSPLGSKMDRQLELPYNTQRVYSNGSYFCLETNTSTFCTNTNCYSFNMNEVVFSQEFMKKTTELTSSYFVPYSISMYSNYTSLDVRWRYGH